MPRTFQYGDYIREKAYHLWINQRSDRAVAKHLKDIFPEECARIAWQTICKWRKKEDWEARLERRLDVFRKKTGEEIVYNAQFFLADLQSHYEQLSVKLKADSKTPSYNAMKVLLLIQDRILELTGERNRLARRYKTQLVADAIFKVLAEDEVIERRLQNAREELLLKIDKELSEIDIGE